MNKLPGNLAAAVLFGALWPLLVGGGSGSGNRFLWLGPLLGQLASPDRDLTTVVLVLVLLAAQYMAGAGLAALLRPLARALREGLARGLEGRSQSA
jgi:hypothetical protein